MLLNIVLLATAGYAGLCLLLFLFQTNLVYFPAKALHTNPERAGLKFEDVWLTADDGVRVHGWFVPHDNPRGTLLFFHGNAGNIADRIDSLSIFHDLELSTLIIDYHGYGSSGGTPGEKQTYLDALAAWNHLVRDRKIAPQHIVLFGRSLGAGVAAWLASEVRPAGLIMESSFTSVPDLAAKVYPMFPVRWLSRIRYDAKSALSRVRCPVLIVHSPNDEIVPYAHGRALYETAPEPKYFLELRGNHNDGFIVSGSHYFKGLDAFLIRALKR